MITKEIEPLEKIKKLNSACIDISEAINKLLDINEVNFLIDLVSTKNFIKMEIESLEKSL